MNFIKTSFLMYVVFLFAMIVVSCSGGKSEETLKTEAPSKAQAVETKSDVKPETKPPVTITFYKWFVGLTADQFDTFFKNPVQKKFPNVTLQFIDGIANSPTMPENMILAGTPIDIILTGNATIPSLVDLNLPYDMNDLVKKNNVDLTKFDNAAITAMKDSGVHGELYGIPVFQNLPTLFYNKDIFDKFAVAYPKGESTWNDILELSKKLTRQDGDIQFKGIIPPNAFDFDGQKAAPLVDTKNMKALVNTTTWQELLKLMYSFYQIDGIMPPGNGATLFYKDHTSAMLGNWMINHLTQSLDGLNWDMTTYPSLKEQPGIGRKIDAQALLIGASSKQKDQAFEIISYLTSEDVQVSYTRNGRLTILNNQKIKDQFGMDLPVMKGKDLKDVLKIKNSNFRVTKYDDLIWKPINNIFNSDVITGKKDINTALREVQEQTDAALAQEMAK
jgi:multiple sugar transport system substrate-binding protein